MMEEMSPRDYLRHIDVYRSRVDRAVCAFTQSVRKLEEHHERCEKFFYIPLRSARTLLRKCKEIQEGLYSEIPDFQHLEILSDNVEREQRTYFNEISQVANMEMCRRGFTAQCMLKTYKKWLRINGSMIVREYHLPEFQHRSCHAQFMMEIFAIPPVNVFSVFLSSAESGDQENEEVHPVFLHNSRVIERQVQMHLRRVPFVSGSTPTTPSTSDDEEDFDYLPVELGEYREFEMLLSELESSQPER